MWLVLDTNQRAKNTWIQLILILVEKIVARHLGKSEISIISPLQAQSSFQNGNVDFSLLIILLDENRRTSEHRKQWFMRLGTRQTHKRTLFLIFKVMQRWPSSAVATCNIACSSLKRISFSELGAFNARISWRVEYANECKCLWQTLRNIENAQNWALSLAQWETKLYHIRRKSRKSSSLTLFCPTYLLL